MPYFRQIQKSQVNWIMKKLLTKLLIQKQENSIINNNRFILSFIIINNYFEISDNL